MEVLQAASDAKVAAARSLGTLAANDCDDGTDALRDAAQRLLALATEKFLAVAGKLKELGQKDDTKCQAIVDACGAQVLVHTTHPEVQSDVALALHWDACGVKRVCASVPPQAFKLGGMEVLLGALSNHRFDAAVKEALAWALRGLVHSQRCDADGTAPHIAWSDGGESLVEALRGLSQQR